MEVKRLIFSKTEYANKRDEKVLYYTKCSIATRQKRIATTLQGPEFPKTGIMTKDMMFKMGNNEESYRSISSLAHYM